MKKKTLIFGTFLLLPFAAAGGGYWWLNQQAEQFQADIQSLSDGSGLEYGHLRLTMGDLEQSTVFPVAKGQMRLSLYNQCTGTTVDLGKMRYAVGQVPEYYNTGELAWYPPGVDAPPLATEEEAQTNSDEPAPPDPALVKFTIVNSDGVMNASLVPLPWMSTLALAPKMDISYSQAGLKATGSAQNIKFGMVTRQPDDFLARDFSFELNMPSTSFSDSDLRLTAGQFGFEQHNLKNLQLDIVGEAADSKLTTWLIDVETEAMMFGNLLLDSSKTHAELKVGDTDAAQFILRSLSQSCAGFATAASHEFNVRAAFNSLINSGFTFQADTTVMLRGEAMKFELQTDMAQQINEENGYLNLPRALTIATEVAVPFQQFGTDQRNWARRTGFFGRSDVRKAYTHQASFDAEGLINKLKGKARRDSNLASELGTELEFLLKHAAQALYLKEFTYAAGEDSSVPRVNFSGLKGVRIDTEGNARMVLE